MCGIVAFASRSSNTNVIENILEAYGGQANRGQKGFGLTVVGPDLLNKTYRATSEISMLFHMLEARQENPAIRAALFHHRYPTSTKNTISGTHPFIVSHETELKYEHIVVHNGVLSNEFTLAKEHREKGYQYGSQEGKVFNDSEAGSVEYARAVENPEYVIQAQGSQAYVSLVVDKETSKSIFLTFGTNGDNPLVFFHKNRSIRIASELSVGVAAEENKLYTFDFGTGKLTSRELKFVPEPVTTYYRYGVRYQDNTTPLRPTPMGFRNRTPEVDYLAIPQPGALQPMGLGKRVDVDKYVSQATSLIKAYRDLLVKGEAPSPKATSKRLYHLLSQAYMVSDEAYSEGSEPKYRRTRGGV